MEQNCLKYDVHSTQSPWKLTRPDLSEWSQNQERSTRTATIVLKFLQMLCKKEEIWVSDKKSLGATGIR